MNPFFEITIIIGGAIYLSIVLALFIGLCRLKPGRNRTQYPVSVIVAARNEANRIEQCLAALARQDYPAQLIQFILINDRSTDSTAEIMDAFCQTHPNSIKLDIPHDKITQSPKKYALTKGIARAGGKILLFTDADCQPPSHWISEMIRYFEPGVNFVAGFSPLKSNSLWGKIIEFDSLASAIVAAGSIGIRGAVTCTGRNLAYTKAIFQRIEGYKAHSDSLSGDDDLFLQQVKKKSPGTIRYAIGQASNVPAIPITNLRDFIRQRRRHFSAGRYYSWPLQIICLLFHAFNLLIFIGLACSLIFHEALLINSIIFSGKLFADISLFYLGARKLYHLKILRYFLPWELYFVLYNSIIGPSGLFSKIHWK